jgi:hypothetical protein
VLGLFLLVKLFTLGGLGVLLVTWRPAAERADLEATLLSFAAASVAVLLVGTVENARWLKQRRPSPPPEGTRAAGAARPAAPSHSRSVTDPRGQAV